MRVDEYSSHDAVALAGLVRSGAVYAAAVTAAAIAAMEALNPRLNAIVLADFDRARATAGRVDRAAPLAGVPFLVKDVNLFAAEWPTTFSSRFFADARPRADSALIGRWRAAGLVFAGKTNTPEFAADFVTEPLFRGPTLNPWNPALTVGGSSGGAAAAVAAGMVPAAHGTDVGGSIRIPAACCGLFGLKPSRGFIPLAPWYAELGAGLNSDHVLTRSVRDSAAFLDVSAGPAPGSPYHVGRPVPSFLAALDRPPEGLRIALVLGAPGGAPVDPAIAEATGRAANLLESMGHRVETAEFPAEADMGDASTLMWMLDIAADIRARAVELGREPGPEEIERLSRAIYQRMSGLGAIDYMAARRRVHAASVAMEGHFAGFDMILTPATATMPPPLGAIDGRSEDFDFDTWMRAGYGFAPFSELFNVTGQPAASLPMYEAPDGMPIGIQLVGRQGADHVLLALAAQIEAECRWLARRPPLYAGAA